MNGPGSGYDHGLIRIPFLKLIICCYPSVVNAVGDGFLELLAPRRDPVYQDYCVTMACLSWTLHLWFSCGYC